MDPGVSEPSTWMSSFEKRIFAERPALPVWFSEFVLAVEEVFIFAAEEVLEDWRALWSHPVMRSARSGIVKGRAVLIDMTVWESLMERAHWRNLHSGRKGRARILQVASSKFHMYLT